MQVLFRRNVNKFNNTSFAFSPSHYETNLFNAKTARRNNTTDNSLYVTDIAHSALADAFERYRKYNQRDVSVSHNILTVIKSIIDTICVFDNPYVTFLSDSVKIRFTYSNVPYVLDYDFDDENVFFLTDMDSNKVKEVEVRNFSNVLETL